MNIPTTEEMLYKNINKTVQSELDKAIVALKQVFPKIQIEVRREMFQAFKLITGIIIEQEFVKVYGHGFDLSSLQHSLVYIQSDKSLDINIDYNPNVFRFNDKVYMEKNKFNQNAKRWERKNRKYLNPDFYTDSGSFADFYNSYEFDDYIDNNYTDEDDYMEEILMDYENLTFTNKRNPEIEINLDSTYATAIKKAKQGFNMEWQRSIKNHLESKYGIKLT